MHAHCVLDVRPVIFYMLLFSRHKHMIGMATFAACLAAAHPLLRASFRS